MERHDHVEKSCLEKTLKTPCGEPNETAHRYLTELKIILSGFLNTLIYRNTLILPFLFSTSFTQTHRNKHTHTLAAAQPLTPALHALACCCLILWSQMDDCCWQNTAFPKWKSLNCKCCRGITTCASQVKLGYVKFHCGKREEKKSQGKKAAELWTAVWNCFVVVVRNN